MTFNVGDLVYMPSIENEPKIYGMVRSITTDAHYRINYYEIYWFNDGTTSEELGHDLFLVLDE